GVWWAMLASPIAGSLLNYLYYRTGRWKRHVVVRRQPAGAAEAELSTGGASP
ncbi:MAG: MATE family efflux transporter, partial [Firmicutes bacterium]|nr:MATE family efflux transporter [Bacillota bacterium]